jgi:hypothetical protein
VHYQFLAQYPDYDYYLFVEYDCVAQCSLEHFVLQAASRGADFVALPITRSWRAAGQISSADSEWSGGATHRSRLSSHGPTPGDWRGLQPDGQSLPQVDGSWLTGMPLCLWRSRTAIVAAPQMTRALSSLGAFWGYATGSGSWHDTAVRACIALGG